MAIATPNPHHTTGHRPWNKWHLIGPKPPLKLPGVMGIRIRLQIEHNTRQLALFNLAIDSKLRGCDLVSLQVRGVIHGNQAVKRAAVIPEEDRLACSVRAYAADATGRGKVGEQGPPATRRLPVLEPDARLPAHLHPGTTRDS